MSNKTNDGPAPHSAKPSPLSQYVSPNFKGLVRREFFAVQLMAAIVAADKDRVHSHETHAKRAVQAADALIRALTEGVSEEPKC